MIKSDKKYQNKQTNNLEKGVWKINLLKKGI